MRPEKHTYIYLSLEHLPQGLWNSTDYPVLAQNEYSLYVHAPTDKAILDELLSRVPAGLAAPLRLAHEMGAAIIIFDRDEDPLDDLPVYEW